MNREGREEIQRVRRNIICISYSSLPSHLRGSKFIFKERVVFFLKE